MNSIENWMIVRSDKEDIEGVNERERTHHWVGVDWNVQQVQLTVQQRVVTEV
jgi:hypothetical protein